MRKSLPESSVPRSEWTRKNRTWRKGISPAFQRLEVHIWENNYWFSWNAGAGLSKSKLNRWIAAAGAQKFELALSRNIYTHSISASSCLFERKRLLQFAPASAISDLQNLEIFVSHKWSFRIGPPAAIDPQIHELASVTIVHITQL